MRKRLVILGILAAGAITGQAHGQTSLASNDHQTAEPAALYRAAWPLVE
jgi:hypothetical protein